MRASFLLAPMLERLRDTEKRLGAEMIKLNSDDHRTKTLLEIIETQGKALQDVMLYSTRVFRNDLSDAYSISGKDMDTVQRAIKEAEAIAKGIL